MLSWFGVKGVANLLFFTNKKKLNPYILFNKIKKLNKFSDFEEQEIVTPYIYRGQDLHNQEYKQTGMLTIHQKHIRKFSNHEERQHIRRQ
ncbi:hypothetical protein [Prevotella sp.]|uniref:hypothetical protein n=1 Tax=Prevotella sp. TaxID=59823 RepID=UPI0030809209